MEEESIARLGLVRYAGHLDRVVRRPYRDAGWGIPEFCLGLPDSKGNLIMLGTGLRTGLKTIHAATWRQSSAMPENEAARGIRRLQWDYSHRGGA